ncbi:T9SS type A sorting domain-containing protein [Hymenobacter negativus]|uniref:T9SS type A sorting domain-containing protein n=1 Tax=Hymenobacter negativus TaxID=2795026 RepID=A0ABS0Q786_9BACT|nr:T9SS type A sorting domain-containing protein [Hymenobacter negativus]MBH8558539.1 T9SS type A sorting domain-containing protein [Hymenobacter negativus]
MKFMLRLRAALAGLAVGTALTASAQTMPAPAWTSARSLGTGSQFAGGAAIDAAGNTYEAGSFNTNITLDGVTLTSQGSTDGYLAKFSPSGALLWVRQIGSAGYDSAFEVAVDASGNAYLVGSFTGTIALGNGSTLQLDAGTTGGSSKGFLVRFSPQGTPVWAQQSSPSVVSSSTMSGVGLDAAGNVCVGGLMYRTLTIGSSTVSTSASNAEGTFLGRFSAGTGALQQLTLGLEYAPTTGGTTTYYFPQLIVAPAGQLYLLTQFSQALNVAGVGSFSSRGLTDVLVARFGTTGTPEWAQQFGGTGIERAVNGTVDAAGNIYVAGYFSGPATFGSSTLAGFGSFDGCLVKYSPQGTQLWVKAVGGSDSDGLYDVLLDAAGNVYTTGNFNGTAQFGGAALTSAGLGDVVVASYTPQGQLRWQQQAGGPANDIGTYLALDPYENLVVRGRFGGTCPFGAQVLSTTAPFEAYVARLGSVGLATRAAALAQLAAYPNPATTWLQLPALAVGTRVQLFDALGRVARETPVAADASISVQGLAPGLYTLRATDVQGQTLAGKVSVE